MNVTAILSVVCCYTRMVGSVTYSSAGSNKFVTLSQHHM